MQRSLTLPNPSPPPATAAATSAYVPPTRILSAPAGQQRAAAAAAAGDSSGQKRPAQGNAGADAPARAAKVARREAKPEGSKAGKPKKLQQLVKKAARGGF